MMPSAKVAEIATAIADMEREHGLRVLFAVESGSRAWGFASADSDWDVRAVAVRPLRGYLRLGEPRSDTWSAMLSGDLDIVVWDLRKAAAHWAKGNAAVTEWFGSPIVYRDADGWLGRLRDATRGAFRPETAAWHYASMWAKAVERAGGIAPRMPLKPLCYALRANVCARWAMLNRTMPPTRFDDALAGLGLSETALAEIHAMVARKACANEWDETEVTPAMLNLLDDLRPALRAADWSPTPAEIAVRRASAETLEHLFQEAVLSDAREEGWQG